MRFVVAAGMCLLVASCTKANPKVCCESHEDCASIGAEDDERTCALGLVCTDHTCSLPPDAPAPQCTKDEECMAPTPRCAPDLTCVACVEAGDCSTTSPVCDATEHTCRGCALDTECASKLCEATTGLCVAETAIAYASPTGSGTATCTQTDPCSIQRAFAISDANRNTVYLLPGSHTGNIVVANKTVHVHGVGALMSSTSGVTLTVNDDGAVDVHGVIVSSSAGTGGTAIVAESLNGTSTPSIAIEDGQVESAARGITLKHAHAAITRSKLHATADAPISAIIGSMAELDRSTVVGSGPYLVIAGDNSLVAFTNSVLVGQSASGNGDCCAPIQAGISLSFTTLINTIATCTNTAPSCTGSTHNGLCVDNSIVANFSPGAPANTMTGQSCVATYSVIFPQTTSIAGAGNKIGMNPKLVNVSGGDYHLQGDSPAIDGADPAATLMTDFDGKGRPQGAKRDIGAFEYP